VPPDPALLDGRVDVHVLDSDVLRANPLGDPHARPLWVQVPHGHDDAGERLPVVYLLQGYFSRLADWDTRVPFRPTVPEAIDARFAAGSPPAIVVYVDAWTAFGGSQFVDSPAIGRYATYVADEVVDFVDARYRTRADPAHRAVAGHSSGGFGALSLALTRPDRFSALASHAGDALYEYLYLPVFARAVRALRS
jgi:enterochelin esterase-like enzyme